MARSLRSVRIRSFLQDALAPYLGLRALFARYAALNDGSRVPKWLGAGLIFFALLYATAVIAGSFVDKIHVPVIGLVLPACLSVWMCSYAVKINLRQGAGDAKRTAPWVVFAAVALPYLVFAWYASFSLWAGLDTNVQWQYVTGELTWNDWHPVLHTGLIYLAKCLAHTQTGCTLVQVVLFAAVLAYAHATLKKYGYPAGASACVLFVAVANPVTLSMMRVLWKDSAFSLAGLAIVTSVIHIYETHGGWLRGVRLVLFALLLFLASFLRHNGIFLTLPLVCLLPFVVDRPSRKRLMLSLAVFVLASGAYLTWRGALTHAGKIVCVDPAVGVCDSKQSFSESVGLPMCVMAESYCRRPHLTPPEVKAFLERMGPREDWLHFYHGSFNSVKYTVPQKNGTTYGKVVSSVEPRAFCNMFLATLKADPRSSLRAFLSVTEQAWAPFFRHVRMCTYYFAQGVTPLTDTFNWYFNALDRSPVGTLVSAPGAYALLLVLSLCYGILRQGFKICIFGVPLLCYHFGTMMFLMGADFRFFYLSNLCGGVAALAMLISRPCEDKPVNTKSAP